MFAHCLRPRDRDFTARSHDILLFFVSRPLRGPLDYADPTVYVTAVSYGSAELVLSPVIVAVVSGCDFEAHKIASFFIVHVEIDPLQSLTAVTCLVRLMVNIFGFGAAHALDLRKRNTVDQGVAAKLAHGKNRNS